MSIQLTMRDDYLYNLLLVYENPQAAILSENKTIRLSILKLFSELINWSIRRNVN